MAVGSFTIKELLRRGATRIETEVGQTYEWTSDISPADGALGGARATPVGPWIFGGTLRKTRTDYPGARTPSIQVLGPSHKPTTLSGRWDDRYNYPGYAMDTLRSFREMCRRGNVIRLQFQNQAFEVMIDDWEFQYVRDWYVRYSFTADVLDRPEEVTLEDRVPSQVKGIQEAHDEVELANQALLDLKNGRIAENSRLAAFLKTDIIPTTDGWLDAVSDSVDSLSDSLDVSEFDVAVQSTINPFKKLASQFQIVTGQAASMVDSLVATRSDVELGVRTALSVLNYEDWSRSLRYTGRVLMGISSEAASDTEERADPAAVALYRPFAGESLYRVSRTFYGTPHAWQLIADRNGIDGIALDGTELLIIPERGTG